MGQPVSYTAALADEAATIALAADLVDALPAGSGGWLIGFCGELGAGKSTFARAMLRKLGHEGPVPSPTYTLVEPYKLPAGPVYHVDLYRIVDPAELEFLGLGDLRDGLLLVEWPERAPALLADADIRVDLRYAENGGRAAALEALTGRAEAVLRRLHQAPGGIK